MKKTFLICLCVIALLTTVIFGTLAWLADSELVTNTFTMGKVNIQVDEAAVNPDGSLIEDADRVTANDYHLIPGHTYIKDPTLTVNADSEEAYIRMLLTLNCKSQLDAIFAPGTELTSIFNGYDGSNWIFQEETVDSVANTVTYEFRYKETVAPNGTDVVLDALFDSFTIPGTLDGADLESLQGLTITITGHAIQAEGFATADLAWTAFETQMQS